MRVCGYRNRYNDRISFIRIFGRVEVIVYDDESFNGSRQTVSRICRNWLLERPNYFLPGHLRAPIRRTVRRLRAAATNPAMGCVSTGTRITGERISASAAMRACGISGSLQRQHLIDPGIRKGRSNVYDNENFNGFAPDCQPGCAETGSLE